MTRGLAQSGFAPRNSRGRLPGRLAAMAAATVFGVVACGNEGTPVLAPTDILQGVKLTYESGKAPSEEAVPLRKGQIVNLQITSDTAGTVFLEGYNLSRPVKAKGSTLLAFSANNPGTFDLVLRHAGGESPIAELDVQQ